MSTDDTNATPLGSESNDQLGLDPERAEFSRWCVTNGHGTLDDVMAPLLDRSLLVLMFSAWRGGRAAERERCAHVCKGIAAGYTGEARRLKGEHATHAAGQRDGANECAAAILKA